jgi:hypothetical protein
MTLHPQGKAGVNIEKTTYDAMRRALLKVIPRTRDGVRFGDLGDLVVDHLDGGAFPQGKSVLWYVTTVKLDLEARGEIEQVPGAKPMHLRRVRS